MGKALKELSSMQFKKFKADNGRYKELTLTPKDARSPRSAV